MRVRGLRAGHCLLLGLAFTLLAASGVGGESEFPQVDVYRMVQFDQGGEQLGSRRAGVNQPGVTASAQGDLSHKAVIVEFGSATVEKLEDLVDRKAAAVVIVLPEKMEEMSAEQREQWKGAEAMLMSKPLPSTAVYFAVDGKQAREMVAKVEASTGDIQIVVDPEVATRVTKVEAENIQGMLEAKVGGEGDSASSESSPMVAIVAHYDTFGIAPGLGKGADSNGSGMIALLELARLFGKAYSSGENGKSSSYNIIFLLTAGAGMNFAGAKQWLSSTDARLLDTVEFALCIDSIGIPGDLYLHTSKPLKDATMSKVFSTISSAATAAGTKLTHVHKKVNISDTNVAWEHEQFSRKRILSGTISRYASQEQRQASLLDTVVDQDTLKRNILIVANAVAKYIHPKAAAFDDANVEDTFLAEWAQAVASERRTVGMKSTSPVKLEGVTLADKAEKILKSQCGKASSHRFLIVGEKTLYRSKPQSVLSAYTVRPVSFDLLITVCVLAYLLGLLIFLQGSKDAQKTIHEMFMGKKVMRKRA